MAAATASGRPSPWPYPDGRDCCRAPSLKGPLQRAPRSRDRRSLQRLAGLQFPAMEPAQLHHSPSATDGLPILPTRTPTRAIAAAPPRPSCANGRTTAVLSVGNPPRVGLASLPHPSRRWHRFGSELNTALIVHEAGGFRHCRGFPHVHARPPCGRSEAIAPWNLGF